MTKQKTLVETITPVVGYDRVYAQNALREIADWIENHSNWYYLTPSQLRQEAELYE